MKTNEFSSPGEPIKKNKSEPLRQTPPESKVDRLTDRTEEIMKEIDEIENPNALQHIRQDFEVVLKSNNNEFDIDRWLEDNWYFDSGIEITKRDLNDIAEIVLDYIKKREEGLKNNLEYGDYCRIKDNNYDDRNFLFLGEEKPDDTKVYKLRDKKTGDTKLIPVSSSPDFEYVSEQEYEEKWHKKNRDNKPISEKFEENDTSGDMKSGDTIVGDPEEWEAKDAEEARDVVSEEVETEKESLLSKLGSKAADVISSAKQKVNDAFSYFSDNDKKEDISEDIVSGETIVGNEEEFNEKEPVSVNDAQDTVEEEIDQEKNKTGFLQDLGNKIKKYKTGIVATITTAVFSFGINQHDANNYNNSRDQVEAESISPDSFEDGADEETEEEDKNLEEGEENTVPDDSTEKDSDGVSDDVEDMVSEESESDTESRESLAGTYSFSGTVTDINSSPAKILESIWGFGDDIKDESELKNLDIEGIEIDDEVDLDNFKKFLSKLDIADDAKYQNFWDKVTLIDKKGNVVDWEELNQDFVNPGDEVKIKLKVKDKDDVEIIFKVN
jgi:hypothetical protein